MSQPAPARAPGPIDPIRQQLDELDALLQRMLSLPVAAADPEAAPAHSAAPPAAPAAPREDESLPPLPPPLPPPRAMPPVSSPPEPDAPPASTRRVEEATAPGGSSSHRESVRVSVVRVQPPGLPRSAPPHLPLTPGPSAWLAPLVWLNAGFDLLLIPLGPFGRWLRRPTGRMFLAWVGILSLLAAGALVVLEWLGWTQLPSLLQ